MSQSALATAQDARVNRLIAFLVDFTLLSFLTAIIWFGFTIVQAIVGIGGMSAASSSGIDSSTAMAGSSAVGTVISLLMWLVIALVLGAYFVYFQTNGGQTLGMKLFDIAVVSVDGSASDRSAALKRTAVLLAPIPLMAIVSIFVPFVGFFLAIALMCGWLFVEAVVMFVSDDAQRLGDRAANTTVVETSG